MIRVIFIPGNGGGSTKDNWFPYLKMKLVKLGVEVIDKEFPDSDLAREKYWIPFLKELGADKNTILIGHSSGAVAAMRFAEKNPILGSVLVGACYTDLGDEKEKSSGYYNRPWKWNSIKNNQKWIIQFASTNDPWIPIQEARTINEKLGSEYYEFTDQGHFGGDYDKKTFPELLEALKRKLKL
ncbi:MAG TPA: alpha/beta hydrolase [Patescibacteria group bacterium]|nr:alpha/beta hydrolase [Patescibacteria group bacterium]